MVLQKASPMAERAPQGRTESPKLETYTYSAGSFDRLKTNEEELFELVKLSGVPIDKELFKVILELLKLNVAPTAILQVLKSLRSQSTPDDLESRSPVPERKADSHKHHHHHHHKPPQPSPSLSSELLSSASGSSLDGGATGGREGVDRGADKRARAHSGEHGKDKAKRSSSDRHQSKHHKGKGHGSSGSRRHEGVRHKIKDPL